MTTHDTQKVKCKTRHAKEPISVNPRAARIPVCAYPCSWHFRHAHGYEGHATTSRQISRRRHAHTQARTDTLTDTRTDIHTHTHVRTDTQTHAHTHTRAHSR